MRTRLITVAVLLLVIAACNSEPKTPPPPVVVPPTPTEIAEKIIADGYLAIAVPPPGRRLPADREPHVKRIVRSAVDANSGTPEGKEALDIVTKMIEQQISGTLRNELWDFVIMYCETYEILQPGSPRYTTTKADAAIELAKPVISKIQIITDHNSGSTTILANIYLPLQNIMLENERLYVGDERPDLQLKVLSLVGRGGKGGIRVEYLKNGDEWIVER